MTTPIHPQEQTQGFDHSKKRIAVEIGLLLGIPILLIMGVIWAVRTAAPWLVDMVPIEMEESMGEQAWSESSEGVKVCSNPGPKAYVEEIAAPLLAALDTEYTFRFKVVDDPQVNAFALPGGFVTVNMGLLEKAETGEEVAAVLAHEIHHVVHRHGLRRVIRKVGGFVLLSMIFGGTDVEMLAYMGGEFFSMQYDRDQEREADEDGRSLLMHAGISPLGMSTFFARLAEEAQIPEVLTMLSTHPDPGERAQVSAEAAKDFTPTRTLPSPEGLNCY